MLDLMFLALTQLLELSTLLEILTSAHYKLDFTVVTPSPKET